MHEEAANRIIVPPGIRFLHTPRSQPSRRRPRPCLFRHAALSPLGGIPAREAAGARGANGMSRGFPYGPAKAADVAVTAGLWRHFVE